MNESLYFEEFRELEEKYFSLVSSFDLQFPRPLNLQEEKEIFFEALEEKREYNPQLKFTQKYYDESKILMLKQFKINTQQDLYGLKKLLKERVAAKINEIECHKNWGRPISTDYVIQYRGKPSWRLLQKAKKLCRNYERKTVKFKTLDPQITARKLLDEVLRLTGEKVNIIFADIQAKVNISPQNHTIKLNPFERFTSLDVKRLKVHEIGTHYMRYYNGRKTGIRLLSTGTANYIKTEEGLAAYVEELKGVSSQAQMYIYAGRVIATYYAPKKSFYQLFKYLKKFGFKDSDAFSITYRAKRNLSDTSQKGGFTKDYVYFAGYHEVRKYAKKHDIRDLFIGKVKLDDMKLLRKFITKNRHNIKSILDENE